MSDAHRLVAVSTVLFDGYSMQQGLTEIARAGARHVEPAYIKGYLEFDESAFSAQSAARLSLQIKENDLLVRAVSAHMNLSDPSALDMLHRRVDFAARLGAEIVILNSGPLSAARQVIRTITLSLPHLERTGIALALENPGHGEGDLLGNARMGRDLIERIGSPHCRLNYDAGNIFTYSKCHTQPAKDLDGQVDLMVNLHVKDIAVADGDWVFTGFGSGDVDYGSLWSLLPRDLPVTLELPLRLERPNGADPVRRDKPVPLGKLRKALAASLAQCRALDEGLSAHV